MTFELEYRRGTIAQGEPRWYEKTGDAATKVRSYLFNITAIFAGNIEL